MDKNIKTHECKLIETLYCYDYEDYYPISFYKNYATLYLKLECLICGKIIYKKIEHKEDLRPKQVQEIVRKYIKMGYKFKI